MVNQLEPKFNSSELRSWLPTRGALVCEGRVASPLEQFAEYARVVVDVERCQRGNKMESAAGRVRLSVSHISNVDSVENSKLWPNLRRGSFVRFRSSMKPINGYANPGTWTRVLALRSSGVVAGGWLRNADWLRVVESASNRFDLLRALDSWRLSVVAQMETAVANGLISSDAASLLRAMILGEGAALESEIWEEFRSAGVIHVLVVSGLHVGIVAAVLYGFFWWMLRRSTWLINRFPIWRLSAAAALFGLWGYVLLTGARLPAVRAGVMVSVWLAAEIFGRRRDNLSALALAAIVVMLIWPLSPWLPSFQLSFAAVAGIMLWSWFSRCLKQRFDLLNRTNDNFLCKFIMWVGDLIGASLFATVAVTPIIGVHFHDIALFGLLTNIFVIPYTTFILVPLGMILLVIPWWPTLFNLLVVCLGYAADLLLSGISWVNNFASYWEFGFTPTHLEIIFWYVCFIFILIILLGIIKSRKILIFGLSLLGLFLISNVVLRVTNNFNHDLKINFIDVGQGSAAVVSFPNGAVYLIDGGGGSNSNFDIGEWVLAPTLHRLQINKIDKLFATHYHADHYGGLAYIAEHFGARELLLNGSRVTPHDALWPIMSQRFDSAGVVRKNIREGESWQEGEVSLRVLHPFLTDKYVKKDWNENNRSIVLEISYGSRRILITGDIESETEKALLERNSLQKSDLLWVPHHGSNTSSTPHFIDAVSPSLAVISCGRFNKFNFPRDIILARYKMFETKVLRTDLHGMITIKTDGEKLLYDTFLDYSAGD